MLYYKGLLCKYFETAVKKKKHAKHYFIKWSMIVTNEKKKKYFATYLKSHHY